MAAATSTYASIKFVRAAATATFFLSSCVVNAQLEEFFAFFPPAPTCSADGTLPDDYATPHTIPTALDSKLEQYNKTKEDFMPATVVVVGGSRGIGRTTACYWAAKGKQVFSLSTLLPEEGLPPVYPIDCQYEDDIINIRYDVSQDSGIGDILKNEYNVETIDFLFLNAGRDIMGSLREWTAARMAMAMSTNVFGLHQVWTELREMLNPDMALVLGASSIAANSRFMTRRTVYSMSKRMLMDLILGYAVEERGVQPNTHYGVIAFGDFKTNFGLTLITPNKITSGCLDLYERFGEMSNNFLQVNGLDPAVIVGQLHTIYAFTALANEMGLDPVEIPQSYIIEPDDTHVPYEVLEFNHNLVPAQFVNELCYGGYWTSIGDILASACFGQCPGLEFLEALINPRVDMMCECPAEDDTTDGKKTKKGGKKKSKHESEQKSVCVA